MDFFDFFRKRAAVKQPTLLDRFEAVAVPAIVSGYRRAALERNCAPTNKTSDAEIVDMYKRVGTAFREVSEQRGERLPALQLNYIVLYFLSIKESMPEAFASHVIYELDKYRTEGLRETYKRELPLL